MADVFDHEQVEARGMRRSVLHPTVDEVQMPGSPMNFSRTPTDVTRHPPRLDEHTDEILREYGYVDVDVERYHEIDVI